MKRTYYIHRPGKFNIDDITFRDLNMDKVFDKLDMTVSSLGEEILYSYLRIPFLNEDEKHQREDTLERYTSDSKLMNQSIKELTKISKLKKNSVFEYFYHLDEVPPISSFQKYQAPIFMIAALLLIAFNPTIGILASTAVYFYNAIRYFKLKGNISSFYICLSYISKAVKIGSRIPFIEKTKLKRLLFLSNASFVLGNLNGETIHGGSGNPLDIIINILKMGLHIDIIRFYSLLSQIRKNKDDLEAYLTELGTIDAAIALWQLKTVRKVWSLPEFHSTGDIIIKDAVHPLIDNCVPNSIQTGKSVLLTGSNASGKSTFLRTLAINMILAQTFNITFTGYYRAPFFRVISSMSVTDDILKGNSYYMAEIKALKRIIDVTQAGHDITDNGFQSDGIFENEDYSACSLVPVCAFVDEVLNGTNTLERVAASTQILRYLSDKGFCFGATHDLELTELLKDEFNNYHFSEDICSDDIHFSFKLMEGPSQSTNAIRLLQSLDYPREITDGALEAVRTKI